MSPFTCRLGPRHAVDRPTMESTGRIVSGPFLSVWEFFDSGVTACGLFGFFAFHRNRFLVSPLLLIEARTNYRRVYSHAEPKMFADSRQFSLGWSLLTCAYRHLVY